MIISLFVSVYFCLSFRRLSPSLQGGDLDVKIKQWRESGRSFSEHLIVAWCVQLLLGIKYIHER